MARKSVKPRKVKAAQTPAIEVAQPKPVVVSGTSDDGGDWWSEEPKRDEALKMVLLGVPKVQIAKELDVHRNTINNWFTHPVFVLEVNQRMREHMASVRVRRLTSMNRVNDRVERITQALAKDVEVTMHIDDKGNPHIKDDDRKKLETTVRLFREMNYEYRENREQERADYGDDVKKVSINQQTTITGDLNVQHSGINDTMFADYIKHQIDTNVLDVQSIEHKNEGQLLLTAAEHLLVDSDLLERINEEDKLIEEAENG